MPIDPVTIAGIGVISAIGNNAGECLRSFEQEQAGIGEIRYLDTVHRLPVGEVKANNEVLAHLGGVDTPVSRTALLSLIAAKEALEDAAIPGLSGLRTGFISANTVGEIGRAHV